MKLILKPGKRGLNPGAAILSQFENRAKGQRRSFAVCFPSHGLERRKCIYLYLFSCQFKNANFSRTQASLLDLPLPSSTIEMLKKRKLDIVEVDYPRITYDAATRTFDRLFKGSRFRL